MMRALPALALSLLGAACSGSDPVETLRARAAEVASRPEHGDGMVTVQHVLIAYEGAPKVRATRSLEEAEQLAAEVLRRVEAGEDFATLMSQFSDDPGGVYVLVLEPRPELPAGALPRGAMVKGFGDVAWRLQPGEVGVAPHDPQHSPFGWHIVQRVE